MRQCCEREILRQILRQICRETGESQQSGFTLAQEQAQFSLVTLFLFSTQILSPECVSKNSEVIIGLAGKKVL